VKFAPIIFAPIILALGIAAGTAYRLHGSSRVNGIGPSSALASSCSSSAGCMLTTAARGEI